MPRPYLRAHKRTATEKYLYAAVFSLFYTLLLWAVFSIFGEPSYMHHHSLDVLSLVGIVSLFSHAAGQPDATVGR